MVVSMIAMSVLGGCAGGVGKDSQTLEPTSEAVSASTEGAESGVLSEGESSQAQTKEDKSYSKVPDPVTAGSYTLEQFSDPEDEYGSVLAAELSQVTWDFVILQENTNAALSARAETAMYPYARKLDELIKKAGGQTAFLMTWAPKDGAQMFTREMVQTMLSEGYTDIVEEGTYLAACGAYALFFQESPMGNAYLYGLDEKTAGKLQEIAGNYMLGQE